MLSSSRECFPGHRAPATPGKRGPTGRPVLITAFRETLTPSACGNSAAFCAGLSQHHRPALSRSDGRLRTAWTRQSCLGFSPHRFLSRRSLVFWPVRLATPPTPLWPLPSGIEPAPPAKRGQALALVVSGLNAGNSDLGHLPRSADRRVLSGRRPLLYYGRWAGRYRVSLPRALPTSRLRPQSPSTSPSSERSPLRQSPILGQ